MSKAIVYAANTANQTTGVINFGNTVRRYGCNCYTSGGNLVIKGYGYYKVDTNVTATAGANGTMTLSVYKDGVLIPGATQSITVAANSIYSLSIPTVARSLCDCESTITAELTGAAGTINNATIMAEKI